VPLSSALIPRVVSEVRGPAALLLVEGPIYIFCHHPSLKIERRAISQGCTVDTSTTNAPDKTYDESGVQETSAPLRVTPLDTNPIG
jgi:hypothetical protein